MASLRLAQSVPVVDNTSNDNTAEAVMTPDPTIASGELIIVRVLERGTGKVFTHSKQAGQTWQSTTLSNSVNTLSTQFYWCIFNGTWTGGTIGWTSSSSDGSALSVALLAFSPSPGGVWTLTPDQAFALSTPTSASTLTITGQTPVAAASVTVAAWEVAAARTWSALTAGWTYGNQQVRNTAGSDVTHSSAYLIQTSAAATGNVSNTMSNTALAGHAAIGTFAEVITPTGAPPKSMFYRHRRCA